MAKKFWHLVSHRHAIKNGCARAELEMQRGNSKGLTISWIKVDQRIHSHFSHTRFLLAVPSGNQTQWKIPCINAFSRLKLTCIGYFPCIVHIFPIAQGPLRLTISPFWYFNGFNGQAGQGTHISMEHPWSIPHVPWKRHLGVKHYFQLGEDQWIGLRENLNRKPEWFSH